MKYLKHQVLVMYYYKLIIMDVSISMKTPQPAEV